MFTHLNHMKEEHQLLAFNIHRQRGEEGASSLMVFGAAVRGLWEHLGIRTDFIVFISDVVSICEPLPIHSIIIQPILLLLLVGAIGFNITSFALSHLPLGMRGYG